MGASPTALLTFFTPQGLRLDRKAGSDTVAEPNMTPADSMPAEAPTLAAWQPVLQELKVDLGNCFSHLEAMNSNVTALLAPLSAQMQELKSTVNEVTQNADLAMELGLATQDHGRLIQPYSEWAIEQVMHLENQLRAYNIKLRGFHEGAEGDTNLAVFMTKWMAMVLQLERDLHPLIDLAYRSRPTRRPKTSTPRGILVKLADVKVKSKLLAAACSKGALPYESSKILTFPDLSAETLEARCRLQLVTNPLQKSNVHYCWVAYSKILVQRKESALVASDLDTGAKLLKDLNITVPPDFRRPDDTLERPVWQTT